jgi:hypothetical protein
MPFFRKVCYGIIYRDRDDTFINFVKNPMPDDDIIKSSGMLRGWHTVDCEALALELLDIFREYQHKLTS